MTAAIQECCVRPKVLHGNNCGSHGHFEQQLSHPQSNLESHSLAGYQAYYRTEIGLPLVMVYIFLSSASRQRRSCNMCCCLSD